MAVTGAIVLYAALAVLSATAAKLLHRHVIRDAEPHAYAFLLNALSAILFLPLAFRQFSLPSEPAAWIVLVVGGLLWSAVSITSQITYKGTEVSLKEPVGQSRLIWALLFGTVFLGETATVPRMLGTLTVFIGVSLLLWHPERRLGQLSDPGVRWTLLAAFLAAAVAIVDKAALGWFEPEVYIFLVYLMPTAVLGSFLPGRTRHLRHLLRRRGIPAVIAILLSAATYYFTIKAYALADVTQVYPLLQLATPLVVLGGILILREREHLVQRIIGSVIVVAGAILVGL